MRCPAKTDDEEGRLRALAEYGLSDDLQLASLSQIVDLAVELFDVPVSAVNMVGDDHVFFAAQRGIDTCDMSRDVSFCAHAITQQGVMVVNDALLDPRFYDNPLVTSGMVRFYAGAVVRSPGGHPLGALCVIDSRPRVRFDAEDGRRLAGLARLVEDKLELRRLQRLEMRPLHFEASAAASPNAIVCFDSGGRITAWNPAAVRVFGYSESAAIGRNVDMLVAEEDRPRIHAGLLKVLDAGVPIDAGIEVNGLRADGERFPAEIYWSCWREEGAFHFGAIATDMSGRRGEHDALYHLANFDSLTGLANRNLFQRRATAALGTGTALALIVSDFSGFTDVNNTLGYGAGDRVLQVVADRIETALPPAATAARIGFDQFAVLLVGDAAALPEATARHLIATIAEPIVVGGQEVRLTGNCGIAVAPGHGDTVEALMGNAGLALLAARHAGGHGTVVGFYPALREEAVARRIYDAELHRALERKEFALFFQPQLRLADGAPVGAEALIRWIHPKRGVLAPAAFLPQLEEGVLAEATGSWVIEAACDQVARWRRIRPDFRVSVNLFAAQFRSGRLPGIVRDALAAHDLPGEALELEITENIILDDADYLLAQLNELRTLGVQLSFDDFGTGFASLNMLRTYPVTDIKIDRSFTKVIQTSPKDRAIILALLALAEQFEIGVVAEGVERQEDHEFLREHGCARGQGYLYSKPAPAPVFEDWLLRRAAPPRAIGA